MMIIVYKHGTVLLIWAGKHTEDSKQQHIQDVKKYTHHILYTQHATQLMW